MRYNFLLTNQYNRWSLINLLKGRSSLSTASYTYFLNKQKNNLLLYFLLDFALSLYTRLQFYPYIKNGQLFFSAASVLFFDVVSLTWFVFLLKIFFYFFSFFLIFFFIKNFLFWNYFYFFLILTSEFYVYSFLSFVYNFFYSFLSLLFYLTWYPFFFMFNVVYFFFIHFNLFFNFCVILLCYLLIRFLYYKCLSCKFGSATQDFQGSKITSIISIVYPLILVFGVYCTLLLLIICMIITFVLFSNESMLRSFTLVKYQSTGLSPFHKQFIFFKHYFLNINLILKRNLRFLFLKNFSLNSTTFPRNMHFNLSKPLFATSGAATTTFDKTHGGSSEKSLLISAYKILATLFHVRQLPDECGRHFDSRNPDYTYYPAQTNLLLLNNDSKLFLSTSSLYHFNTFVNLKFILNNFISHSNKQHVIRQRMFSMSSAFTANLHNISFLKTMHNNFITTNTYNFFDIIPSTCFNTSGVALFKGLDLFKDYQPFSNAFKFNSVSTSSYFDEKDKFFFYANESSKFYGYHGCTTNLDFFVIKNNFIAFNAIGGSLAGVYNDIM